MNGPSPRLGERAACIALIVAAGRGARLGRATPKQYLHLLGEPILRRAIRPFLIHPKVDAVGCVIHPDDRESYEAATAGMALLPPRYGGADRQNSTRNGLEGLLDQNPAYVLVHDAARPFVSAAVIDRVIDALASSDGAIAALPVQDTLKRSVDGTISATVDRTGLWRAQTPQGFRYRKILDAHRAEAGAGMTDDAGVAHRAGIKVALVAGDEENFKITTEDDLKRAELILSASFVPRVGLGFDVHRVGPGDHVVLGGVAIPHSGSLQGHSDADVALHAITDALLGAIGAGDIGSHFPPSDPRWRGADSAVFLRHAADLVRERDGEIEHVDLTIICEFPKIGPHRERMVERIAALLLLDTGRVSVKATTTERLGFTGRGEGIAAQAVATVRMRRSP